MADNQSSGQGSLTALAKLKMLERWRAEISPDGGPEPGDPEGKAEGS